MPDASASPYEIADLTEVECVMAIALNSPGPPALPPTFTPALPRRTAHASIRRHLALALGLSAALVLGVGGWASLTQISGAVITPGQLVVESDVKKVQHPTGGVVGELRVRGGDRVNAGDVLIRLDDTQTRANLDMTRKALDELSARRAREEAERDGTAQVVFPPELLAQRAANPEIATLI